jgi:predicted transposase YbfD/YdcC
MSPSLPATVSPDSNSELSVLHRLRAAFAQLPDTRQCGKVLHRLDEVLLRALELRGATVTIDAIDAIGAIGAQTAIAAQIHEAGADYVLALKANQGSAHQAIASAFGDTPTEAPEPGQPELPAPPPPGALLRETLEPSHGRCEKREYQLLDNLDWFAKSWKWAGLQAVGKVRREVQRERDDEAQIEVHYFLCSFKGDIERFATLVREHWSVENRCHWVLDVTFGEDHCQVRDRTAAHNFSLLRELAMKALRDHPGKLSLRRKRRRAALDPDFRLQILGKLHA